MIAYYLHSRRPDRVDRARAVLEALGEDAVAVSPDSTPFHWARRWDRLADASTGSLAAWVALHRPAAVVLDGPAQLVRAVSAPGRSTALVVAPGTLPERLTGPDDLLLAPWASGTRVSRWPDTRTVHLGAVGAVSRRAVARRPSRLPARGAWHCVSIAATASGPGPRERREILAETGGWQWWFAGERDVLDEGPVWDLLLRSDVLVCEATPANLAAAAATEVPAVLVLPRRPSAEQTFLADAAARTAPVVVATGPVPAAGWRSLLDRARCLDPGRWAAWSAEPGLRELAGLLSPPEPGAGPSSGRGPGAVALPI